MTRPTDESVRARRPGAPRRQRNFGGGDNAVAARPRGAERRRPSGRSPMSIQSRHWQHRLALLADKPGAPGATLAVVAGGEVADTAYGVLTGSRGGEATPDSLFQIGSITKVWTA